MTAALATKKPRVVGIVIFSILGGLLSLAGGALLLTGISAIQADPDYAELAITAKGLTPFAYLAIGIGVLELIVAVLLLMYKRIGLILAAVAFGLGLLLNIYNQVSGSGGLTTIGGILLDLAILYYVYIYLTREPDKNFFT
jgi:hypothetical protein